MRIWHEQLIPKLCRQHLLAMWREGLGAYSIIVNNKKGYRNHPAVKEFEYNSFALFTRLLLIRQEMLQRGYMPKTIKPHPTFDTYGKIREWQTLDQQIDILKNKNCNCKVS